MMMSIKGGLMCDKLIPCISINTMQQTKQEFINTIIKSAVILSADYQITLDFDSSQYFPKSLKFRLPQNLMKALL
jgi:hypothetical protein